MQVAFAHDRAVIFLGDSEQLGTVIDAESVDAVVTDPPAGIEFMGREWDSDKGGRAQWVAWLAGIMSGSLAALKPGGHALVWAIPRTAHWTQTALEDAGFEIRDVVTHLFATGFPKSLDVSKAIDKRRNDTAEVRRVCRFLRACMDAHDLTSKDIADHFGFHSRMVDHWAARDTDSQPNLPTNEQWQQLRSVLPLGPEMDGDVLQLNARKGQLGENWHAREITGEFEKANAAQIWKDNNGFAADLTPRERRDEPASPEAAKWSGWGTALKPAAEFWILVRKPLGTGVTVARNVVEHGTGALNIDGCRIASDDPNPSIARRAGKAPEREAGMWANDRRSARAFAAPHEGEDLGRWPANLVLSHAEECATECVEGCPVRELGSVAKFFYAAKPSTRERDEGCEALPVKTGGELTDRTDGSAGLKSPRAGAGRGGGRRNHHPTVKSIALMRYLCRLITPPGGTVLDPFTGSGSTGVAAIAEGFSFVGVEQNPEYVAIAKARIEHALRTPSASKDAA